MSLQIGGFTNSQTTDPEIHRRKSILSRLAVKSLFNSTFDGGSTVPSKIKLDLRSQSRPKSTYLGRLPRLAVYVGPFQLFQTGYICRRRALRRGLVMLYMPLIIIIPMPQFTSLQ